jgi:hypothetical protein
MEIYHVLLAVRTCHRKEEEQRQGVLFYCGKWRLSFIFRRVAGVGITEGPALAGARAEVL